MTVGVAAGAFFELAQQLLLALGEAHRRLHYHVAHQVAVHMAAHVLDALAAQAEDLAALCFGGDLQARHAFQRRDLDLAAERRGGDADRHLAVQVVVVALEYRVLADVDLDVEVARWAAIDTRFAVAGVAQAHALVDAGGDLHLQRLLLLHPAGAAAVAAGVGDDLAAAVALRAGLLDREEALLHAHLAVAVAGRAGLGLGAGLGAAAVAGAAFLDGGDADGLLGAARGFFQRDLEVVAQVGAAIDVRASAATAARAAKQVAEDVAEGVGKAALEALRAGACAHRRVDAGVAVAVVGGLLLRVGEHLVGLLGLLEFLFRVLAVRIAVRVVLHGQLAVGLLDLVVASVAIDAEDFVVIPFGHDASLSLVSSKGRAGTGAGLRRGSAAKDSPE